MKVSFEEIYDIPSQLTRFLSVKLGSDSASEFEKFDSKTFTQEHHIREQQIIYQTIKQIQMRGVKSSYFRPEGPAVALPGKDKKLDEGNPFDYGVRLYAILAFSNCVILLNGDIKTHKYPDQCDNVKDHFRRAQSIARKLHKGILDGDIRLTENGIEMDESFNFDI